MEREQMPKPREHVFFKDGEWRVSLDRIHSVPVHRKLAAIIRMGLYASKKLPEIAAKLPPADHHMNAIYRNHHAYNCHRLALEIQEEALDLYDAAYSYKPKIREKFYDPQNIIADVQSVRSTAQVGGFPRWVHFMNDREESPVHSTLILGTDERGTLICFEKRSYYDAPFQLIQLEDVLHTYGSNMYSVCIEPVMENYRVSAKL